MISMFSGWSLTNSKLKNYETPTVIFLHIPKTAGQTLYAILNREYGRQNIYTFVGGRQRLVKSISEFSKLSLDERNAFDLLRGHVSFGIHEHISRHFKYITMLREPAARIISHYHYVRKTTSHALHKEVTAKNMSLRDYVTSGISSELDNGQTRLLAGIGNSTPVGDCTKETLQQAIANIETHFVAVGLTERFDDSILLIRTLLQWQTIPVYVKRNVRKKAAAQKPPSPKLVRLIKAHNQLDYDLYNYAEQRFNKEIMQVPERTFEKFRMQNRFYHPYGSLLLEIRSAHAWLFKSK